MYKLLIVSLLFAAPAFAQLTASQRIADFQNLVALYDKNYAAYEWKRTLYGFDLLDIGKWLDRVRAVKDDLEFYDLQVEYVASLNDTHDSFSIPSDFLASLGFTVDIYDGKVMIDNITRSRLPLATFPFAIGDELVSIDGQTAEDALKTFGKYGAQSNPRSARRLTSSRLVTRPQSRIAAAVRLAGTSAVVQIRRASGVLESYTIPWVTSGTPVLAGPVPPPRTAAIARPQMVLPDDQPEYMKGLLELQHGGVEMETGVLNYGSRTPLYALPTGFVMRQGLRATDFYLSGTYQAGDLRIGYIRIPNYSPPSTVTALTDLETEIAYFQANTDGLVVDESHNTGGNLCFGQDVLARLIPYNFRATGFSYRASWSQVLRFWNLLNNAVLNRAEQWVINLYTTYYNEAAQAYSEQRGQTGPLPICSVSIDRTPATDSRGAIIAYTKPIVMVIDEFSTSTADSVPAMFQDAGRGPLFGFRSNGAGANNTTYPAGAWSEGSAGMTLGLQVRKAPVATPDYPTTDLIESVGVRPDIENDYMTRDNLMNAGRPFVDAVTAAITGQINKAK